MQSLYKTSKMIYNKNDILEVYNMPRYKLSPEERAAKIKEKILSMYAKGMTTSDIEAYIRDIFFADRSS